MNENDISNIVISCAIKVHSQLGPGLLESAYEACLKYELGISGMYVESQKSLPIIYNDVKLDCGYRIDLFVENKLIAEIKAIQELNDIHLAQIITYLKLSKCKLGLLLNFNVLRLKDGGIKRVANGL